MRTHTYRTVRLGELVVAAFDVAARYSADPQEASRLATKAVRHMLRSQRSARPVGAMRKSRLLTLPMHNKRLINAISER